MTRFATQLRLWRDRWLYDVWQQGIPFFCKFGRHKGPADVRADWCAIPVADDSYASVFADPPWNSGYKEDAARFVKEALRIAPVAYLMAPWVYGGAAAPLSRVWVRQMPGIHAPILITRYVRPAHQEAFAA